MKYIWIKLVILCYFGLIGFAIYYTKSAWPLVLLLFIEIKSSKDEETPTKTKKKEFKKKWC
jgi:hypothetical protein